MQSFSYLAFLIFFIVLPDTNKSFSNGKGVMGDFTVGAYLLGSGDEVVAPWFCAQGACHVVQGEALGAGDGTALHVVWPGSEHEKEPFGAGGEVLAGGLVHGWESFLYDGDKRALGIENGTGYLFLSGRDARADDHGAFGGAVKEIRLLFLYETEVLLCGVVMAAYLQAYGAVEEPSVAYGGVGGSVDGEVGDDAEEVGVHLLDGEAHRVLPHIVHHVVQLPLAGEDGVLIALLEERTARRVEVRRVMVRRIIIRRTGRATGWGGRAGLCLLFLYLPEGAGAADLEAFYDLAEMRLHLVGNKEDTVDVIRHELQAEDAYLRIELRDVIPAALHLTTYSGWNDCGVCSVRRTPCKTAETWLPVCHAHRYHVYGARLVVMNLHTPLHGMLGVVPPSLAFYVF